MVDEQCVSHWWSLDFNDHSINQLLSELPVPMYLDGTSIRKALALPSLLEVLSDLLQRYSQQDPTLQQPLRSVLPIDDQQK